MAEPADPDAFDGNDYRKRVLAAVARRGGPDTSDPFELYDLPPVDDLDDGRVAERVAEVWGFWQRQRDHPKYRVLVAELVGTHDARSGELLDAGRRRVAAARVRAQREQRDAGRYALLDAAISRLVDRHGAIPADKVDGLHEVGALAGLTREEVTTRLRRHRISDGGGSGGGAEPGPAIGPDRRRQLRALLDELGRLTEHPAPPTLLALLELPPTAAGEQIRARAAAWRSRARELPPGRLRAVLDELLVHVAELLEPGRDAVERYLAAVTQDVAEHLRPRVRAAVLVEDRLVADDHAHLLEEAIALGLDRPRAAAVLAAVAAELGAPVETDPPGPAAPAGPRPEPEAWQEPLRAARAALRAGRPTEAQRLVAEADRQARPDGHRQVRAVADEVAAVLAAAERHWRAGAADCAAGRFAEAVAHLEELQRTASDLPDAQQAPELLARARAAVDRAEAAVAAALSGPESERAAALARVLADCPGHPGASAALAALPLAGPAWVNATRDARGDVVVLWAPSHTAGVSYKVSRLGPDGSWHVVGRVSEPGLADGGAPVGVDVPVYAVVVLLAGQASVPCRSDAVAPAAPPVAPGPVGQPASSDGPVPPEGPAPPQRVTASRVANGSVEVRWIGTADVEYRVRCLGSDGRWRVVGRTRATMIEDGGAPPGPLPVYTVSAASAAGVRSAETRSAG